MKERYGNKHIRHATEKAELKISSEKVTLMHQTEGVDEDDLRTLILMNEHLKKYVKPEDIVKQYGSRLSKYELEEELPNYKRIYYFTEDCLAGELFDEKPKDEVSPYDDKE